MGLCLQNVGVLSADSRDNMGKFRWAAGRGGGVSVNQSEIITQSSCREEMEK